MAASRTSGTPLPLASPSYRVVVSATKIAEPGLRICSPSRRAFGWLVGNEKIRERRMMRRQQGASGSHAETSGLESLRRSHDRDFGRPYQLHDHRFRGASTATRSAGKDLTYSGPLLRGGRTSRTSPLLESSPRLIFMGDFPLATDKGTFIVNSSRRVTSSPSSCARGVLPSAPPKATDKPVTASGHLCAAPQPVQRSDKSKPSPCASTASASRASPSSWPWA